MEFYNIRNRMVWDFFWTRGSCYFFVVKNKKKKNKILKRKVKYTNSM